MSTPTLLEDVRSVLVVAAHPDDIDFGAAGTVAGWTAAGIPVSYCVRTSGEASGPVDRNAAERTKSSSRGACASHGWPTARRSCATTSSTAPTRSKKMTDLRCHAPQVDDGVALEKVSQP